MTRPAGERRPECHACQEAAEGMERRLAGALAEGSVAEELGRTCERHAWQLARRRARALNVPLALLGAAAERRSPRRSSGPEQSGQRSSPRARLPPAGSESRARFAPSAVPTAAPSLLRSEAALDREVAEGAVGMRRPVALCRIHLSIAARLAGPRPHWSSLLAHQAARWRHLSAALAEFIRKHDYRFSSGDPRRRARLPLARGRGDRRAKGDGMIRCPRCGHENPEGELFCASCQERLPRPSAASSTRCTERRRASWRARRRKDATYALVWGLAVGLGTLAIGLSSEASGGDPSLVALGKQLFWLVGLPLGTRHLRVSPDGRPTVGW